MDTRAHRIQMGQAAAEQLTQYLHTLSAEAWHHPSACAGWEVCDVVAHLALGATFYASTVARGVQGDTAPPAGAPLPPQRISRGDLGAVIDRAAPLQQARAIRCRSNVDSRSAGLGVALPWTPWHKT